MTYNRNIGFKLIEEMESEGKRAFTIEEAMALLGSKRKNALAVLGGLIRAKRIISPTEGFYALWHPSERKWGIHPLPILDVLMKYRKCPYYVGLLSAADHYGAAHHKPQVLQVIIPKQITFRKAKELAVSFHVCAKFSSEGLLPLNVQGERTMFSSPERTVLDILYFESVCGGFRNVSLVVRDLMPILNTADLKKAIDKYPFSSSIQRLGYMLEYFDADKRILNILIKWAKENRLPVIALSSRLPKKGGFHPMWRVIENAKIEGEE